MGLTVYRTDVPPAGAVSNDVQLVVRPIERNMLTQMLQNRWRLEAECVGMDSDLFFPPKDITAERKYEYQHIAISICSMCLVKDECLAYALSDPVLVTDGVWGGLVYDDIRKMRRRNKRKSNR
jgi:hypothetical protein